MSKKKPIERRLYHNTLSCHRDRILVRKMLRDERQPMIVLHVREDFLKMLNVQAPRRTLKVGKYTPSAEDKKHFTKEAQV